ELAEEIGGPAQFAASLRRPADCREKLFDLGFRQADAVVLDDERRRTVGLLDQFEFDRPAKSRLDPLPVYDGVNGVMQQFPHEARRAAVKMLRKQSDHAAQVHLESSGGFVRHDNTLSGEERGVYDQTS